MTKDNQADTVETALERIRDEPVLGDFATPLPRLSREGSDDLGATFERLSELIGASKETTTLNFRIADDAGSHLWSVTTEPGGCSVTTELTRAPDLEVIVDAETWSQIANGSVSPLEALGRGKMRVRGDVSRARRIVRRLRRSEK
jgi:putative sterol carrier protein